MKKRVLSILCILVIALNITACNKTDSTSLTTSSYSVTASSEITEKTELSETAETSASSEETTAVTTEAVTKESVITAITTVSTGDTSLTETSVATTAKAAETAAAETVKTAVSTQETTVMTTAASKATSAETAVQAKETEAVKSEYKTELSNPNASKEASALFDYICKTYRSGIISGQQESTWKGSDQYEFDYIYKNTGKYPAIRGLDYMNDDFDGVNKRAAEWHDRGGIVTICWHCGCDFSGSWSESMNTEITDWDKALTEGTPEYEKLIKGMDKAAAALKKLEDENIPVLWRPFHEFDGAWFWWGKGGAENFKKLWIIMYDRYTNYWGLDNLIWVLGYSGNGRGYENWYPGSEYVDIAGADSYTDGANGALYKNVSKAVGDEMPICFHECGRIPTVEQLEKAEADWVWFMTWHTEYITDHNDTDTLKKIYNDDYVITLDELPDLY